jgi:4-amino-4-deoxy-L-arabinose transferase-like glycosyltransferase
MNEKSSGMFYHINYLFSIIPYSILVFFALVKDFSNYKKMDWKIIFMYVWFLTGLVILTLFKTKLEVYVLMILVPVCFIIPIYINEITKEKSFKKILIILFTVLNVVWFATESIRPELKLYAQSNKILSIIYLLLLALILFLTSKYLANKIELKKTLYIFILIFFFAVNVYYLLFIPEWVNKYKLTSIKEYIDKNDKTKIIYIGSNYRYNPQFSFYFNGLNLNPERNEFQLLDTKDKIEEVKKYLEALP